MGKLSCTKLNNTFILGLLFDTARSRALCLALLVLVLTRDEHKVGVVDLEMHCHLLAASRQTATQ